jgi:hypothetical protein
MNEEALSRLYAAIAAHLASALRLANATGDELDVELVLRLANATGDELEDAVHALPRELRELRSTVLEPRRKMAAALRGLNQRILLAGRISMIERQCAWSREVLARVPELMHGITRNGLP